MRRGRLDVVFWRVVEVDRPSVSDTGQDMTVSEEDFRALLLLFILLGGVLADDDKANGCCETKVCTARGIKQRVKEELKVQHTPHGKVAEEEGRW